MTGPVLKKNEFYSQLLKVAIPVMLQQLIVITLNLADTIMVGKVSALALAAVGAANQVFFVYIDCIFGFLSGVAVYAVQYWGIRDLKSLRKIIGIAYALVIAIAVPVTIIVYICAPNLISIFTDDIEVIQMGTDYLRIVVFTYLISALTFVITYNSRAVAMLKWPTIINACAVSINIFLNYCLIYGKLGMPELGVKGAALATLIARITECAVTFIYIYISKDHPIRAKISEMKFDMNLFGRVMKTAIPVVFNEALWVFSFTTVFAIYGKIGPIALAVVQVAMTISDFFQTVYFGLSNGCTVVVGQALGQGKRELGYEYSKKCINIAWILNAVTTILLILARSPIAAIYGFDAETTALLMDTLFIYALTITPKMMVYVFICGVLRPGGDTVWCLVLDGALNWVLQVPMVYLAVAVFKWTLPACVAFAAIADIIKTIACYYRFFSKKWINVFTGVENC